MTVDSIVSIILALGNLFKDVFDTLTKREMERIHSAAVNLQNTMFELIDRMERELREQEAAENKVAKRKMRTKNGV